MSTISRRRFLKALGLGSAAIMAPPIFLPERTIIDMKPRWQRIYLRQFENIYDRRLIGPVEIVCAGHNRIWYTTFDGQVRLIGNHIDFCRNYILVRGQNIVVKESRFSRTP